MTAFNAMGATQLGADVIATAPTAQALYDNLLAAFEKSTGAPVLANNYIVTVMLTDGNVTTAKLADAAATTTKLADGAVTAPKLSSASVTEGKLDSGAVTVTKLGNGAVTVDKLSSNAVTNAKILKTTDEDSVAIGATSVYVIPAGIYMLTNSADVTVEVYTGGAWRLTSTGMILSDGTNMRLNNASGSGNTVYYRKLG
jgi:hypothetical protein